MGYACPDTAACDAEYYGIFNQLYHAAWQFAWYSDPDGSFTWLRVGQLAYIRYHPTRRADRSPS